MLGESPGQPTLVSHDSECPAVRVGRDAPWKGSGELLGGARGD